MADLDIFRVSNESEKQWQARREFLARHINNYEGESMHHRLVSLSMVWSNHVFLGCCYGAELMKKVKEMGEGIDIEKGHSQERKNSAATKVPSAQKSSKLHPRLRFEAVRFVPATSTDSEVAPPLHKAVASSFGKIDKEDEVTCKATIIESKEHEVEFLPDNSRKERYFDTGYDLRKYSWPVKAANVKKDPRHGVMPQLGLDQQLGAAKSSHLNRNPETREQGVELTAEVVQTRNAFYQRLYKAVSWKLMAVGGLHERVNHTELLTSAMQVCKATPDYIFLSLDQLSSTELPDSCQLPSHGFICEVRCREVYLSTGYASSQDEARDTAMEEALRTFLGRGVYVQYISRRSFLEHDDQVGDLVLNSTSVPCTNFPPALHRPFECSPTAEADKQGDCCNADNYPATDNVRPKEPQDFVILENSTDAITILTNSANFNNAVLEFKIFRHGEPGLNCCKVLIRGVEVASVVGVHFVQKQAAELALSELRRTQPTIRIKSFSNASDDHCEITRKDINEMAGTVNGGGSSSSIKKIETGSKILEDNLGNQMLRRMGWSGGGIGKKEGIVDPVQATRISGRQGLGLQHVCNTVEGKDKGMKSNMQQLIQQFLMAEDQPEIKFSNELTKAERKQLHCLASKYSLKSHSYGKGKKRFLVLRKKLNFQKKDSMMKILLQQGTCGRYSLSQPGVAST
uniref:protein CDKN2AIP homolog A-like n=1 Tax=Myxine glutinosa TaxID=7769 RepID=UPI00358F1306